MDINEIERDLIKLIKDATDEKEWERVSGLSVLAQKLDAIKKELKNISAFLEQQYNYDAPVKNFHNEFSSERISS